MQTKNWIEKSNKSLNGILLMTAGIFVVSLDDAGSKFLVEADYHPFQLMGLSAWIVVFILLTISVARKRNLSRGLSAYRTDYWRRHMARAGLSVVTGLFFLFSLKFFKLVDVTIIFFLSPIAMTALSAVFLKEHVGAIRWTAVVLGFLGVAIALQPDFDAFDWKILLPLAGSLTYAVRAVLIRGMSGVETATQIVFHTRLGVALLSTVPMIVFWTPMAQADFALVVGLAVLLLIAHILITKAIVTASLPIVGPFEYTALIWTALLGYLIWGDLPSSTMSLGAGFIVGAGLLIAWRETLRGRARLRI